jgi:hypothetical protein
MTPRAETAAARPAARRRPRLPGAISVFGRRRLAIAAIAAALVTLAALDVFIVLHPEQLRRRLVRYIGRSWPGEVLLEGVRFRLTGRGEVARAVLRRRADPGEPPAGELRLAGLRLDDAPLELLRGRYRVTGIEVASLETEIHDPARFLETFRTLLEIDPDLDAPMPPIAIGRVTIRLVGCELPLAPAGEGRPIVFERFRITPEGGGRRFFRITATYRGGPFEECGVAGRIDMASATLALDLRASNVDVRGRSLRGLSPSTRDFLAAIGPAGPVDLALSLSIPWHAPGETTVKGEVDCYALALSPRGFPRPITRIAGRIRFDGPRIEVEELRGVYAGAVLRGHGTIADLDRGAGVALDAVATGLDLSELAALPLPEPFAAAVRTLAPRGRAELTAEMRAEPSAPMAGAPVKVKVAARAPVVECGPLSAAAGELALEGRLGVGPTAGSLRIERGELAGVALRGATGRVSIDGGRLSVEGAEGRIADGAFRAAGWIALESGALELDAALRDLDVAPLASAVFGQPLAFAGRASGTLAIARAPGAARAAVRAELELGAVDPRGVPGVSPLCEATLAEGADSATYAAGRFSLSRGPDGAGTLTLALRSVGRSAVAEAKIAPDGTLDGRAVARGAGIARTLVVAGTLEAPTIEAMPNPATRTAR